jgi:hypothetical protein
LAAEELLEMLDPAYNSLALNQTPMRKTKKIVLIVVFSTIGLLWFADQYPTFRFRGDAKFSGGPVLGYEIKMRLIPFHEAGEYVFHFRGIPDQKMSLQLFAEGKTNKNREELTDLNTTLDAVLLDQNGRAICQVSGTSLRDCVFQ